VNPQTIVEIRNALPVQHQAFAAFLRALPLEAFLSPLQGTWSPLQHLQHLMAGEKPFAQALETRRFKPLESPATSRTYPELVAAYHAALEAAPPGALVNNPFSPPEYAQLDALETTRGLALSEWNACGDAIVRALEGYEDAELDAVQGKHPLMGWLTLREFAFFMIYHIEHHQATLERRISL
jgi:DinB superfamily